MAQRLRGAHSVPSQPRHSINIYAGISPYGMTMEHEVAGNKGLKTLFKNSQGQSARNITCEEYGAVMKEALFPGGRRHFSKGGGLASWTYQQDNDPSHKLDSSHINAWNTLPLSSSCPTGHPTHQI